MIGALAIRKMVEFGLSAEQIADLCEAIEEGQKTVPDTLAKRREYDRERKREQRLSAKSGGQSGGQNADMSGGMSTGFPPDTDASRVRDNPSRSYSTGKKKERSEAKASSLSRRARFCPDHWNPSEATMDLGKRLGFTESEIALELTKLRDHEFRDPHSDWDRTFREWLRRGAERLPQRARDGPVLAVVDEDFIERQKARIAEYARQQAERITDHRPEEPARRNVGSDLGPVFDQLPLRGFGRGRETPSQNPDRA